MLGPDSGLLGSSDVNTLTYSASMTPDLSTGGKFLITANNGTAFTVNAPLNPNTGKEITFDITNSSGGVLGVITWNAVYKLAGAFSNPLSTKRRIISFYHDGSSWIEKSRASADI